MIFHDVNVFNFFITSSRLHTSTIRKKEEKWKEEKKDEEFYS